VIVVGEVEAMGIGTE